jgi:uncharacterized lipoprotein YmbA
MKNLLLTILTVLMATALVTSCGTGKGEKTAQVTVTSIAGTDIGQAVIFGSSESAGKMMFVKPFYSEKKSHEEINTDVAAYIEANRGLVGKKVKVVYRPDEIGDNIIIDIK